MKMDELALGAITVIAGTVATVSMSVSRQECLSTRARTLTKEFREIAAKGDKSSNIERERLPALSAQILAFELRLHLAVWGHILLYGALTVEVLAFGFVFLVLSLPAGNLRFGVALSVASLAMALGLWMHIAEYRTSSKTIYLETMDIHEYASGNKIDEERIKEYLDAGSIVWRIKKLCRRGGIKGRLMAFVDAGEDANEKIKNHLRNR
jgi:hypothetical protein